MNGSEITPCPDRARLQQLLSGQTSDPEFSQLEAHLLHCDKCSREADALIPSAEVTAMLSRAETQVFRTREAEQVEQLIRKVRTLRSATSANVEQTLIGAGEAGADRTPQETLLNAGQTVAVDASTVSFLRPAQQPDEIGRLGGYRILQVLGSGGMGVVYRAEDPSLKRLVALKVMKPTVAATGSAKERFLREAQFTAAIEHDHIVQIYQVGEDFGVPFIAMPLLRGESLKSRLGRTGYMPQSDVVRIGKEVSAGLAAAHERGLIHRDIKPDNIWIEEKTGRVKILDFGLVRSVSDDTELTQSGMVLGTPKYMAPEQAQGHVVDHRSDLFSLGSVLYHLATGKPAFDGNNLTATLMAVVHQEPQPIEALSPEIHPQLATLIAALVQKDRDKRPQSASLVSQRLADIEQAMKNPSAGTAGGLETLSNGSRSPIQSIVSTNIAEVTIVTQPVLRRTPPKPPRRNMLALAAGAGGLLLMLGILIITIRDKDGKETTVRVPSGVVADIDVQPGSKVSIREEASGASVAGERVGMKSAVGAKGSASVNDRALRFSDKGQYAEIPPFTQWGDEPLTVEAVIRFNSDAPGQFFVLDGWIVLANDAREETGVLSQLVLNEDNHILHGHPAATEIGATCHIAIVRTATTFDFYVNGVRAAEAPGQVTWSTAEFKSLEQGKLPELKLQPATGGTLIGNFKDWATKCDVTFSELRVSNTARYQADFKPQYRYEPDEHTLALYHFDEGESPVLQDASPNQRHGIIYGGTWLNDGITADIELQTRSRINVQKEASFVGSDDRPLWHVGPLPYWTEKTASGTRLKEGYALPGIVERPSELPGVGRWNVDTAQSRGFMNVARYSPDGKWLATGSSDGHVRVYDAATMKLHRLLPGFGGALGVLDLAWHPNNDRIAVAGDSQVALRIWSVNGTLNFEEHGGGPLMSVAWTQDGSRLICGGVNHLEVRAADGSILKTLVEQENGGCFWANIAVAPNSQSFVCWHMDGVRIWNAETGEMEQKLEFEGSPRHSGHAVDWSSSDRIALFLRETVLVFDPDRTTPRKFEIGGVYAAAWHPDGDRLAVWRHSQFLMHLNTVTGEMTPEDQQLSVSSSTVGATVTAFCWSPDGKHLAGGVGRLLVFNDQLNGTEFDSGATYLEASGISLNTDGTQIATSNRNDNCNRIWSPNGTALSVIPLSEHSLAGTTISWSPTDNRLATLIFDVSGQRRMMIGTPNGEWRVVDGLANTAAWSPDGQRLAVGQPNGHVLITDADGKTLEDIDTGETGIVTVGWPKQDFLVAHAGLKILRIEPGSDKSVVSLVAPAPSVPQEFCSATWRPDGQEVYFANSIFVNLAEGVTDRVRSAPHAAAWAPDSDRYLQLHAGYISVHQSDGTQQFLSGENGSHWMSAGAWHPSEDTVFVGYDQSLLMARNADDLHVKWTAVVLPEQKSLTFHASGSILDGKRSTLEKHLVYYTADAQGNVDLWTPDEFEMRIGQEVLPEPGRYFDAEFGFTLNTGDDWKPTPLESVTVPGVARAAFTKTGGVLLNVFIQETGDLVDASWMLAESAKAQEEKLSATVLEKEVRKIAGRDAMWMVVEGQGNGSAIDGKGPVKTTQHWIAIPREKDVVVALLTSPSGTFATNQALFLKAIETLQLKK